MRSSVVKNCVPNQKVIEDSTGAHNYSPEDDSLTLSDLSSPCTITANRCARVLMFNIRRFAHQICRTAEEEEEVAARTLCKLVTSNKRHPEPIKVLDNYLRRAIKNNSRTYHEEEGGAQEFQLQDYDQTLGCEGLSGLDVLIRAEQVAQLDRTLASLSEVDRRAIVAFHVEDRTAQQIANEFGVTTTTIFERVKRARNEVRTRLISEMSESISLQDLENQLARFTPQQRETFVLCHVLLMKRREVDRLAGLRIGTTDNRLRNVDDLLNATFGVEWKSLVPELRRHFQREPSRFKDFLSPAVYQLIKEDLECGGLGL